MGPPVFLLYKKRLLRVETANSRRKWITSLGRLWNYVHLDPAQSVPPPLKEQYPFTSHERERFFVPGDFLHQEIF